MSSRLSNFSFYKFIIIVLALILVLNKPSIAKDFVSVLKDGVNLRSGPGKEFDIVSEVGSGFPYEIIDKKKSWLKVRDFENDEGWVFKTMVSNEKRVIVSSNKKSDSPVNVRKEPQSNAPIVGKAHYGVVFKLLQVKGGWAEVRHDSGLKGWMRSSLLWGAGL